MNIAEVGTFMEAVVVSVLSVADVYGVQVDELERRRTRVMAVLMGSSGASFVPKAGGRTARHWARGFTSAVPMSTINRVNRVRGPRFVIKYGARQGVLVLGRQVPLGLGAVTGAGGNAVLARGAIGGARSAFGPAPA